MGRYTMLDTVAIADAAIEIEAATLDDLFATAAEAVAALSVDPATVRIAVDRSLALSAASIDLLLFDWLSELVFLKDAEQLVFPRAAVHVSAAPPGWGLSARLRGGWIVPGATARRADVKAVTFHRFAVEPAPNGWRARVVFDI